MLTWLPSWPDMALSSPAAKPCDKAPRSCEKWGSPCAPRLAAPVKFGTRFCSRKRFCQQQSVSNGHCTLQSRSQADSEGRAGLALDSAAGTRCQRQEQSVPRNNGGADTYKEALNSTARFGAALRQPVGNRHIRGCIKPF